MSFLVGRTTEIVPRPDLTAPPHYLQAGLIPTTAKELITTSLHLILTGIGVGMIGKYGRLRGQSWGPPIQQAAGWLFFIGAAGVAAGIGISLYSFLEEKWHLDGKRVLRTAFVPVGNLLFLETRRPAQVLETLTGRAEKLVATAQVRRGDWMMIHSPLPGSTGVFFRSPANFRIGHCRGIGLGTSGQSPSPVSFLSPTLTFVRGESHPIRLLPPRFGLVQIIRDLLGTEPPQSITVMKRVGLEWEFSRAPLQKLSTETWRGLQWSLIFPLGPILRNGLLLGAISGLIATTFDGQSTPRDYWTDLISGGISGAVGSFLMMPGYGSGLIGKSLFFLAATSAGYWIDRSIEQISKGKFQLPF